MPFQIYAAHLFYVRGGGPVRFQQLFLFLLAVAFGSEVADAVDAAGEGRLTSAAFFPWNRPFLGWGEAVTYPILFTTVPDWQVLTSQVCCVHTCSLAFVSPRWFG